MKRERPRGQGRRRKGKSKRDPPFLCMTPPQPKGPQPAREVEQMFDEAERQVEEARQTGGSGSVAMSSLPT